MEEKFLDRLSTTLRAGKTKDKHLEETLPNHPSKVTPSCKNYKQCDSTKDSQAEIQTKVLTPRIGWRVTCIDVFIH